MTRNTTKAQQARELTGTKTGDELEPLRTALLIARNGEGRVYWPKSVYPTMEAAYAAMGLDFTQYRARGAFDNLVELIEAAQGGKPVRALPEAPAPEAAPEAPAELPEAGTVVGVAKMDAATANRLKRDRVIAAYQRTGSYTKAAEEAGVTQGMANGIIRRHKLSTGELTGEGRKPADPTVAKLREAAKALREAVRELERAATAEAVTEAAAKVKAAHQEAQAAAKARAKAQAA
jgi:hypothetical protein